jgi:hypothetical protein
MGKACERVGGPVREECEVELAGGFYVSPAKLLAFLPICLALESEVEPAVELLLLGG